MLAVSTTWTDQPLADRTAAPDETTLRRAMDTFLAGVEKKAFVIARAQLKNHDDALDVVQDAMLRLVRGYANRPEEEWAPLFFRILTNRIRDLQRRATVRNRVMSWFGTQSDDGEEDEIARAPDPGSATPVELLQAEETHSALEAAVASLPPRQREAFLLRSLEGFDTAQTAEAMGCSAGSVKTHYSRALHALSAWLESEEAND